MRGRGADRPDAVPAAAVVRPARRSAERGGVRAGGGRRRGARGADRRDAAVARVPRPGERVAQGAALAEPEPAAHLRPAPHGLHDGPAL
ncbi:MAG: hypothetical protein EOO75_08250 [Myxococcales bacterium]|nr:MAG: hypothetical protein EOO75_08250 [Myxococcales bacterium]